MAGLIAVAMLIAVAVLHDRAPDDHDEDVPFLRAPERSVRDGRRDGGPSGQRYLRSLSPIGRSLMLAMRRRISPCSSNSQFSLP